MHNKEAYTRQVIDNQLSNLGWKIKENVYLEEPRTKEEKKKLKSKRPDYVLYSSNSNIYEPLAIIEAKASMVGGLDGALDQASEYAKILNAPVVFATNGSFFKARHVKENKTLSYNGEDIDFLIREELLIKFKEKAIVDDRPKEVIISLSNLIKDFKAINNQLRKQGLMAGYERFSEFSTILFLKLFSEKIEQENDDRLPEMYRWNYLEKLSKENWLRYLNDTIFPKISEIYNDKHIFSESLKITNTRLFKNIYDKLNPLQLSYINNDVKGAAFEYFLANSPSSDKDLGEYFTPRHIVKFLVKLLNPQLGEKVYDPFCGTGGMLIESYKHIWQTMRRNDDNIKILKEETLYGSDISSNARIAKMNMILAGDGHNNIKQLDSLYIDNLKEVENKMDVIITNFPFSQQTDHKEYYDIQSNRGDSICLQHCIKALKDGGRMAIIVPEGVLFRKDMKKTREYLMKHCHIDYIISLPQGVFMPYTGIKTNILYCTKKKVNDKVWFYEIKNDGFSLDTKRSPLKERSDLDKFLSFSKIGDDDKKDFGFFSINKEDIIKKEYSLRLNEYKPNSDINKGWVSLGDVYQKEEGKKVGAGLKNYLEIGDINIDTKKYDITEKTKLTVEGAIKVPKNTILISTVRPMRGAITITKSEVNVSNAFFRMKLNKYLYYCLNRKSFFEYLGNIASGSLYPSCKEKDILSYNMPFPSLELQTKIVKEIEMYEKVIEGAKQIVSNYKPNFNINKAWEIVSIKDVAESIKVGGDISSENVSNEKTNVFNIPIFANSLKKNGLYGYTKEPKVIKPCVTVTARGNIGHAIPRHEPFYPIIRLLIIYPKDIIDLKYLAYSINKINFQIKASTTPQLTAPEISNYKIYLPSIDIQRSIVYQLEKEEKIVNQSEELIAMMEKKIESILDDIWQKDGEE